jgi:hypothetical protein
MMGFRSSFLFLATQERDMIEIARFPPTPFFLSAGQKNKNPPDEKDGKTNNKQGKKWQML